MGISPYIKDLRSKVGTVPLLVPSVTAIILDDQKRVLLQRARYDGRWYTVGGGMDPGETPADAVVREVREETGLEVEPVRLVGVIAYDPVTYPNGDVCLYIANTFLCKVVGGTLGIGDDESLELKYFALDGLPELLPDALRCVKAAFMGEERAYFDPPRR